MGTLYTSHSFCTPKLHLPLPKKNHHYHLHTLENSSPCILLYMLLYIIYYCTASLPPLVSLIPVTPQIINLRNPNLELQFKGQTGQAGQKSGPSQSCLSYKEIPHYTSKDEPDLNQSLNFPQPQETIQKPALVAKESKIPKKLWPWNTPHVHWHQRFP